MSINIKSQVNAMSMAPSRTNIVVAGSEVLKLIRLGQYGADLSEGTLLRVGRKGGQTLNTTDVDYNWANENEIITAALNGHVVIWDLERSSDQKLSKDIAAHARAANCVRYHPTEPTTFFSGAQDSTVRKWDSRRTAAPTFVLNAHEKVRHVSCAPMNDHLVAVALETGQIQLWDVRVTTGCVYKFQAHGCPIITAAWHPTIADRLATGGRDKTIRIWDIHAGPGGRREQLACTVQTIAAVARVRWRPGHDHHISSCAQVHDFNTQVWDLRRPHFPLLTFEGHRNCVTDMIWDDSGNASLYTSSKDGFFRRHAVEEAWRPEEDILRRSTGVAWSWSGDMIHFGRVDPPEPPAVEDPNGFTTATFKYSRQSVLQRLSPDCNDADVHMAALAKAYIFRSTQASVAEVCEHNAGAADAVGAAEAAHTWRIISAMWGSRKSSRRNARNSHRRSPSSDRSNLKPDRLGGGAAAMPDLELAAEIDGLIGGGFGLDDSFEMLPSVPSDTRSTATTITLRDDVTSERHPIVTSESEGEDDDLVGTPAVGATNAPATAILRLQVDDPPEWDLSPMIAEVLLFYGEHCDVQMCVTLILVLGEAACGEIPISRQLEWFYAYLELLERMKLWNTRAMVIKLAYIAEITELSTDSTTISLGCGVCNKTRNPPGWLCQNCSGGSSMSCSICHLPVKTLFVWCQGCSHGGHIDHMKEWFATNRECPTGCGHHCEFE